MTTHPPISGLDVVHRFVDVPDARVHLVEQGMGPVVLLVHGFTETWWSWRRQIPALAAAGFRAVAVDLRGHGDTTSSAEVTAHRTEALVQDLLAVTSSLGERRTVVVGHDVGSPVAAAAALRAPDRVRALGMLGVPYAPRGPVPPTTAFAALGEDPAFYVSWFQIPGAAEADVAEDPRRWLAGFVTGLSADAATSPGPDGLFFVPRGARMSDRFPRGPLPRWLAAEEFDVAARSWERTGATGALNRYRNLDRDWADQAEFAGAAIRQPALFVGGESDATTTWMADAIAAMPQTVPGLRTSVLLPGCGHWVQQERPAEVNTLLVEWLRGLPADD
jgi:pimeloyl-ACP methyl ester carboxylesterase